MGSGGAGGGGGETAPAGGGSDAGGRPLGPAPRLRTGVSVSTVASRSAAVYGMNTLAVTQWRCSWEIRGHSKAVSLSGRTLGDRDRRGKHCNGAEPGKGAPPGPVQQA